MGKARKMIQAVVEGQDPDAVLDILTEARPKLKPGAKWGKPITPSEIKVGDVLSKPPDYPQGSIHGKVIKAAKVNLIYEGFYGGGGGQEPMRMELKTRRENMVGGYVQRGSNTVHEVIYGD